MSESNFIEISIIKAIQIGLGFSWDYRKCFMVVLPFICISFYKKTKTNRWFSFDNFLFDK